MSSVYQHQVDLLQRVARALGQQKDNTVRVLRLGAGLRLNEGASPERIAAAVSEVLPTPGYGAAARAFATVLAREAASTPNAADEAERLAGHRAPGVLPPG